MVRKFYRGSLIFAFLAAFAMALVVTPARAQDAQNIRHVTPTDLDRQAAAQAHLVYRHAWPANTPEGLAFRDKQEIARKSASRFEGGGDTGEGRFPADLGFGGGNVVDSLQSHPVYLLTASCTVATCWGNPEGFLRDYGRSDFVHIVDQYIGLFNDNRYTLGDSTIVPWVVTPLPLIDADVQAIVHAVASAAGESGYGHEFHVFLPPGQDECFDATFSVCYAPDGKGTFIFCAYHNSTDFPDIGHVLYSVEPFVDVPGCNVKPGTPNGPLIDSTDNTLSHELTETITDPDGTAWTNQDLVSLFGAEIGDECSFFTIIGPNAFFDPSNVRLAKHRYAIQPEYSNAGHVCATEPQF